MTYRLAIAFVLLFVPLAVIAALQNEPRATITPLQPSTRTSDGPASELYLRVDASLVLVPVHATVNDAPLLNLQKDDFRILEDGHPQEIRYFNEEDAPVSVGLLLDCSNSMKDKRRKVAEAAAAFFTTANRDDEFFLVEFDEGARLETSFTSDTSKIYEEIRGMRPFGRTALFDGIQLALQTMKKARHTRRALVVLSDGGDNRSRRTFGAIKSDVLEFNVPIYAMGIFDPEDVEPKTPEEAEGPELLARLAQLTGGQQFPVDLLDLPEISEAIGRLLRNQYLLGYVPTDRARDGTFRSIKLELATPIKGPVSLRYREGYYAPTQ